MAGPQRNAALADLLRRDSEVGAIRLAVRTSLGEGCGAVLAALFLDKSFRQAQTGQAVLRELASQIGRQQSADDVATLLKSLASLPDDERTATQAVVQGLAAKPGSPLHEQVVAATGGRADELMKTLIGAARERAADENLKAEQRRASIHQLQLGNFDELRATFSTLIAPGESADVQSAAIDTLATFKAPGVAEVLVNRWPGFTPRLRRQAEEVLFSRTAWIKVLLDSVVDEKVKLADLQADRLHLLASHRDSGIRESAKSLLENLSTDAGRSEVVEQYQSVLKMPGDAQRGQAVFKKVCSACHKLGDAGYEIGPNLAAMRNRGSESILLNVLDPSREVNPEYLSYSVRTRDGRTLTGMISAETATSVTLRRADNKSDTVLRIDIDEMRSSGKSLMPDGLEKEVDKQGLADVIEYLRSLD